jgi:prepilin-type N-terminal cleavage/methylation domain-containing protein
MKKGFTLIELMVSIGILIILFTLTTINLTRLPSSTSQSTSYDKLLSDLRAQQTKAMIGYDPATPPVGGKSYGIHFESASYILFTGDSYAGGSDYYTVELDPGLSFDNSETDITFSPGSGDTTATTFSIVNDQLSQTKEIRINKYGATY